MVKHIICAVFAATIGAGGSANAAVVQYTGYSDFQSLIITSDVGADIAPSSNFVTNAFFNTNGGVPGAATFTGTPMEFSGFSAFEIGMTFGNDEAGCCSSTGFFDATLSVFDGLSLLGSVAVASNGNDLSDQFIGLLSDTAFDRILLSYGAGSGTLAQFITRIDVGYDGVSAIPVPAALPLLASGLGLFGLIGWRRKNMSR